MPADTPPPRAPRPGSRRTAAAPVKIPLAGPSVLRFAPYVAAVATVGVLVGLLRHPPTALIGAVLIAPAVCIALFFAGLTFRTNLAPDDGLRRLLPAVLLATMTATLVVFYLHLFPGAPRATVELSERAPTRSVVLTGAEQPWLRVRGTYAPASTGSPDFVLSLTHDGATETLGGRFRPHAGAPLPEVLTLARLHGSGTYTVSLSMLASSLAPPLRVELFARPFRWSLVLALFVGLACLGAAVDAMLWARKQEPSFAATVFIPLGAAFYFQLTPVNDSLALQMGSAGVVGLVAMFVGELAARVARIAVRQRA